MDDYIYGIIKENGVNPNRSLENDKKLFLKTDWG